MSSNDDSPVPQPHSAGPDFSSISSKNSKPDTVDALLRIIFRMDWKDWVLIVIIILCLLAHYISITQNCPPLSIDIIKITITLIAVFFIFRKISSAYESKEPIISFFKTHPIQLFVSIIACGATTAFFLPLILNIFKFIGDTDKLTTALLASTGGVIAVFTLIKTHQKNQNDEMSLQLDREKYEQQKEDRLRDIEMQNSQMKEQKRQFNKKTKQEAYSSHQERIRQIHAERRSRYTKAVEQLANEKAAVRLGGIYTLVGLVDEWLTDDTLNPEERQKEGQVIINNLCSYVRSPFPHAELRELFEKNNSEENIPGDIRDEFLQKQALFREEQDIRSTILTETINRLSNKKEKPEIEKKIPQKGPWSDFSYNFSGTHFLYNVDFRNIVINSRINFSNSIFGQVISFYNSIFEGEVFFNGSEFEKTSSFINVVFKQSSLFHEAEFKGGVSFKKSTFNDSAIFHDTVFGSTTSFTSTHFKEKADFKDANFTGHTIFSRAIFKKEAIFTDASFNKIISPRANPSDATADFNGAIFENIADFRGAYFEGFANFSEANFESNADFISITFNEFDGFIDFTDATFISSAKFINSTFFGSVGFYGTKFINKEPRFAFPNSSIFMTRFSCGVTPESYIFSVSSHSPYKIQLGQSEINGKKFIVPEGTILFDPKSWDEEKQEYTRVSKPAKPLENSDIEEEKPAE